MEFIIAYIQQVLKVVLKKVKKCLTELTRLWIAMQKKLKKTSIVLLKTNQDIWENNKKHQYTGAFFIVVDFVNLSILGVYSVAEL